MSNKRLIRIALLGVMFLALVGVVAAQTVSLTPKEQLGKMLFFDTNLSDPPGQACAACHGPSVGYTGPDSALNAGGGVYEGAVPGRFGNRKPPAAAYASGPILYFDPSKGAWIGGTFWDGRATGWTLGDPLAEQALGPFLNPLEQNMASATAVCLAVQASTYAGLFETVWGAGSLDCGAGVNTTYQRIGYSIAVYERSAEVSPFTSKYDYYLAGKASLTGLEKKGLEVFEGKGKCALCHTSRPGAGGEPPMFTDFTYDNLGLPKNPANPFYTMPPEFNPDGEAWIDPGLGGFLQHAGSIPSPYQLEIGKHKVPTLRNVDLRPDKVVKAYGHNGYFKSLQSIVHFYNMRDVLGSCDMVNNPKEGQNCWPPPEVTVNVNTEELGNLGLKQVEEDALVEFLKTLSDGYKP